jgi:hypothetical protein
VHILTRGWQCVHGGQGLEPWLCWLQHRRHVGAGRQQPPGCPLPALEGWYHDVSPMMTALRMLQTIPSANRVAALPARAAGCCWYAGAPVLLLSVRSFAKIARFCSSLSYVSFYLVAHSACCVLCEPQRDLISGLQVW